MEESKTLYVFDFDDTLVTCDSRVKITKPNGNIETLSAIEFSDYIYGGWPEGDSIDHTEFWEYPPNGRWISWTKQRLDYAIGTTHPVFIITGREKLEPIKKWMVDNEQDIEKIKFYSTDALPKRKTYRQILKHCKSQGINNVIIYEDSQEALDDMLAVCKEFGIKYSGYKMSKSIINAKDPESVSYVCVEMV